MTAAPTAHESPGTGLPVPTVVLTAIAAAWALAVVADLSGRAEVLHHDPLIEGGLPTWAALVLFLAAWQAMIAAMMLPSSLPLIRLFAFTSREQPRAETARAAFLGGYVLVWTTFGAIAFVGDLAVHRAVDANPWLQDRPWLIAGSVFVLAGTFQFSALKEACLSKCRHPGPFLLQYYRRGASPALGLGLRHGLFCVGCCWALMLVLFAAGVASLTWMAALTALMVYEKTARHGDAVTPVAGVALLAVGTLVLGAGLFLPS